MPTRVDLYEYQHNSEDTVYDLRDRRCDTMLPYKNDTVLTTDKTPFLTRQTLNPTGFSGYVREKLVGASYAWNQLVQNGNFTSSSGWHVPSGTTLSVSNNKATVSKSGVTSYVEFYSDGISTISGHKYLFRTKITANCKATFIPTGSASGGASSCNINGTDTYWIYNCNTTGFYFLVRLTANTYPTDFQAVFENCQIIDLTLAFGSTIADYLYGLSNNGGITKLRDMGCPIDKYTAYGNYLVSSKTSGKKIVGKNLFDKSIVELGGIDYATGQDTSSTSVYRIAGYIKVKSGSTYYISGTSGNSYRTFKYDANRVYLGTDLYSGNGSISIDNNTAFLRMQSGTFNVTKDAIQFEQGTSATTYEPYSSTTYSLGNDELRGKFDLVNGEIVASGDVKKSNGEIDRVYKVADLGSFNWTYDSQSVRFYSNAIRDIGGEMYSGNNYYKNVMFSCYNKQVNNDNMGAFIYANKLIYVYDNRYTDAATFKTAITGQKVQYELATPTTEQSTPFADPMSLVGATTEEYIDTREIPCPVGAERQYMGQSEDIVEIPSSPQSDGKRKLVAETSGGKTQYYWEMDGKSDDIMSISGNPISISGLKANQLAVNPIITLEPIQAGSGTPSPSNIRAISGYDKIEVLSCGKNLFDGGYSESGKYLNQDGTLTNGSSWYVTNYIPVKSGISYTLSHSSTVSNNGICWYDENKAYINGALWGSANTKTITLPSNAKYIRASYYYSWVSTFQIEESNQATTYEPYHKTTDLSESLGQTVYGGTLDVRTGVLTVDRQIVDMGDLTWQYVTTYTYPLFVGGGIPNDNIDYTSTQKILYCSCYNPINGMPYASFRGNAHNNEIASITNQGSSNRVCVQDSNYTSAEAFETAVTGQKLVYKLATPFTIQLTPHEISLLKDYAYVSTNGTSIALDYHNGELASLGDVSQLAETYNRFADYIMGLINA